LAQVAAEHLPAQVETITVGQSQVQTGDVVGRNKQMVDCLSEGGCVVDSQVLLAEPDGDQVGKLGIIFHE